MQRLIWWLIAVSGAGLVGLIVWNATRGIATSGSPVVASPALPAAAPAPAVPAPAVAEQIRHPVPDVPREKPLPALDTSDSTMKSALAGLSPGNDLIEVLVLEGFVRRVVATIDNLTGAKIATRILPVRRVPGSFAVDDDHGHYTIAPANAARYSRYVQLAMAIDSKKLTAFYFHYYPLFEQAYRELGYPKGRFNDRLVAVIDHLLEAPEMKTPVVLARPKVFYLYDDPDLEARSAGQKILMRMGTENAARIKAKLRDIRMEITKKAVP